MLAAWSLWFNFAFGGRGSERAGREASEIKFRGELEGTKFTVRLSVVCVVSVVCLFSAA